MARSRKTTDKPTAGKRPIEQYDHKKQYAYDPHLDPTLTWAGKAEHTSFEVSTVSLHSGAHRRVAIKIVDDRGIEGLKIIPVP